MSPSIDKAFNLWSKAVPLLKIKWQCCIREQHLVAGKDRSVGRSHLLPTTSRHGGGWIRGQLSPSSLHTQTVVNQQIAIHVADKFTGKKTQSARRRMRMNGLEWEGLGLCSCSGHGVCAPVWGHGVSLSILPTPLHTTIPAQSLGKAHSPVGQPSPSPAPSQGPHPPPQALLQTQLNRFWFCSYAGMNKPQGAPKRPGIGCVGPKSSCPAGTMELLDTGTALSRGWVSTGAARRDQGGPGQLCATPGSCSTGASLQWPFKPDWKMLCTARLTKKQHFPSCGSGSGCLMSLNGWGGIARLPLKPSSWILVHCFEKLGAFIMSNMLQARMI